MLSSRANQTPSFKVPLFDGAASVLGLPDAPKWADILTKLKRAGFTPNPNLPRALGKEIDDQVRFLQQDAQYYLPGAFQPELPKDLQPQQQERPQTYGIIAEINARVADGSATANLNADETAAVIRFSDFDGGDWPTRATKYPYSWICVTWQIAERFEEKMLEIQAAFDSSPISSPTHLYRKKFSKIGATNVVERSRGDAVFYWVDATLPHRFGGDSWLFRLHTSSRKGGAATAIWMWVLKKHGMNGN